MMIGGASSQPMMAQIVVQGRRSCVLRPGPLRSNVAHRPRHLAAAVPEPARS